MNQCKCFESIQKLWSNKISDNFTFKNSMPSNALFTTANLLPPEIFVTYFDLTKHETKGKRYIFILQNSTLFIKSLLSLTSFQKFLSRSNGSRFPILGKNVYLHNTT